jgi:hypothetical protein
MGQRYVCRSRTHKLLLARDPENCAFFDLGTDPLELTDLFHHPDQQESIAQFRHAIADWLLFDAPPPVYKDDKAPCITPSVEAAADPAAHRAAMMHYFEQHMTGNAP